MPIAIDEISVKNLGPLPDLQLALGPFNLIYGPNEHGKTFLVEFILRSLFRSAGKWRLRPLSAAGRVLVTGLDDGPASFSPSSRAKLEDSWEEWREGLPADMARLLVVKGAELCLHEGAPGGVNRAIVQQYLSSTAVIDAIDGGISRTLQKASVEDGTIAGDHRGEISNRRKTLDTRDRIDGLFVEIDRHYSGGPAAGLRDRRDRAAAEIELLERARRHRAWQIGRQVDDLQRELAVLSDDALDTLRTHRRDQTRVTARIGELEGESRDLSQRAEHYRWLDAAVTTYDRLHAAVPARLSPAPLVVALLALAGSAALAWAGQPLAALLCTLGAVLAGGVYVRQLHRLATQAAPAEEVRRIAREYEARFGAPLTGLPALQAQRVEIQPDYYRSQTIREEIARAVEERRAHAAAVREAWLRVGGRPAPGDAAGPRDEQIAGLFRRRDGLLEELQRAREELARLDVDPSDHLADDPGVAYTRAGLEGKRAELAALEQEIAADDRQRQELKQSICDVTGDAISTPWPDLIAGLQAERERVAGRCRRETSYILAAILVHAEIDRIREQEIERIRERLRSAAVIDPIRRITGRYQGIDLDGDQLVVSDAYQTFRLADLSTGAQEQILLALRIGFASQIMGDERAFLILDDAFQHADWERRGRLMEQVLDLAKEGWQILYFTMDDHIRGLFDDVGRQHFGDGYQSVDLTAV